MAKAKGCPIDRKQIGPMIHYKRILKKVTGMILILTLDLKD